MQESHARDSFASVPVVASAAMKKKIGLGCLGVGVVAIAALLIAAAMQPDSFRVERSREIAASPEAVRAQLADLERWAEWNPWAELDPDMHTTFSDPPSGVGAWYEWQGNDDVGSGRMEITEVTGERVVYDLQFVEPFESRSDVILELQPQGEGTRVTWIMEGDNDFVSKMFAVFMDMEEMIGKDFDKGLANLEEAASRG